MDEAKRNALIEAAGILGGNATAKSAQSLAEDKAKFCQDWNTEHHEKANESESEWQLLFRPLLTSDDLALEADGMARFDFLASIGRLRKKKGSSFNAEDVIDLDESDGLESWCAGIDEELAGEGLLIVANDADVLAVISAKELSRLKELVSVLGESVKDFAN